MFYPYTPTRESAIGGDSLSLLSCHNAIDAVLMPSNIVRINLHQPCISEELGILIRARMHPTIQFCGHCSHCLQIGIQNPISKSTETNHNCDQQWSVWYNIMHYERFGFRLYQLYSSRFQNQSQAPPKALERNNSCYLGWQRCLVIAAS